METKISIIRERNGLKSMSVENMDIEWFHDFMKNVETIHAEDTAIFYPNKKTRTMVVLLPGNGKITYRMMGAA